MIDLGPRVRTVSVLRPITELRPERIDGIINHALKVLADTALADLGPGTDIIIRDLRPSDFPGHTNDVWAETSAASIGYATTTAAADTAIADETFLAIWGVKLVGPASSETAAATYQALPPVVTGWRISIGAQVVAIWSSYQIVQVVQNDMVEAVTYVPIMGLAESPIIVKQNQRLKIEEYNGVAAADVYEAFWIGAVAERNGKSISA